MRLVFGSDHAGLPLRQALAAYARGGGHDVVEVGAETSSSFDYPLAADAVACQVRDREAEFGILVCGSGIGVSIRANRYRGVRAALCTSEEHARLARQHNHANVLCLGGRLTPEAEAQVILRAFLETDPDPDERHERRVRQLDGTTVCPGEVE